jgi:hypothetical protein
MRNNYRGRITSPIILISMALIAQFTIVDFDIGPASLRVYIYFGLFGVIILHSMITRRLPFRNREAAKLFTIYLALILWMLIVKLNNNQPLHTALLSLLPRHIHAISGFIVAQFYVRTRRDLVIVATVMTMTCLLSAFVGIMQWLGIQWFWDLAIMLHPQEGSRELLLGTVFGEWGFVPGLSQYSIPFSYHLITFGMFTISYTVLMINSKARSLTKVNGILAVAILSSAILFAQSRSAIFAYLISSILTIYIIRKDFKHLALHKGLRYKAIASFIAFILVLIITLWWFDYSKDLSNMDVQAGQGGYELNRVFSLRHLARSTLANSAWEAIQGNLLFGSPTKFQEVLSTTDMVRITSSHNMFLNAIINYGILGLLLLFMLLKMSYHISAKAFRLSRLDLSLSWVTYGAIAGLLAYNVNGLFHNDTFIAGTNMPLILLGLLCSIIDQKGFGHHT